MISSVRNPRLQALRKLQSQAKKRREAQAFVIEGVRLAEEALKAGWQATELFFTAQLDRRGMDVVDGFTARGTPAEQLSEAVMRSVSQTETPQGLLVVVNHKTISLPSSLNFVLILDGLRDPGNLGTVLRTAAAAGVQGVLLARGCADAWSPKVLRAGMGAHFILPIQTVSWMEIEHIVDQASSKLHVYLADAGGGIAYTRADFRLPLALIVGGEAAGAGVEATALADDRIHIPMPGGSESLNASIAASILLFEVVRQRGR